MRTKGIIFDCDGVLVDSEIIFIDSLIDYLNTLGISTDINSVSYLLGKPMPIIAELALKQFNLKQLSTDQFINDVRTIFNKNFDSIHLQPMNGLLEFLSKCKKANVKMAVASSSTQNYVQNIVKRLHIQQYFCLLLGCESVIHGKPDPEIYRLCAKKIALSRQELIVIEDSTSGIHAAKSAGIFTVGYKGSTILQDTSEADFETNDFNNIVLF